MDRPHPGTLIVVGRDEEQAHHRDGPWLAFVDQDFNCEVRGHSAAEVVNRLRKRYPHYAGLRVVGVEGLI